MTSGQNSVSTKLPAMLSLFFVLTAHAFAQPQLCVDPGHGGTQPGTGIVIAAYPEAEVNLDIALVLKETLIDSGCVMGTDVIFTREWDTTITLRRRTDIANVSDAWSFLSIHHNSSDNPSTEQGSETWYGTDDVIGDGACSPDFNGDLRVADPVFGEKVVERLEDAFDYRNRGHKPSGGLVVLNCSKMVSTLSEASFINSPYFDYEALAFFENSANHREAESFALYNGWRSYLEGNGLVYIDYAYCGLPGDDIPLWVDDLDRTAPDKTSWRTNEYHGLTAPQYFYLPNPEGGDYEYQFHHWEHRNWTWNIPVAESYDQHWEFYVDYEIDSTHWYIAFFTGGAVRRGVLDTLGHDS